MPIPIITKVLVVDKWESEATGQDGVTRKYYNMKVADKLTYDNQIIGVSEDIYNKAVKGEEIKLKGTCGGLKDKFWRFNELA